MPVGPSPEEVERCLDTVESIRSWEHAVATVLLVNDALDRDLRVPGTTVLQHPLRPDRGSVYERIAAATLAGFAWVRRETNADVVMKLDSDSLVIAPFATKLARAFSDPEIGLLGSYDRTCNGDPRSFEGWAEVVQRAGRWPPRPTVRRALREARHHGYVWGEHALGAGVAVPRQALDRLVLEPTDRFIGTGLVDDPLLGILVRQAGLRLQGNVAEGDTFALAWQGLPDTPDALLRRGYSIIHSVKNDAHSSEAEIRQFFRDLRPTAPSDPAAR